MNSKLLKLVGISGAVLAVWVIIFHLLPAPHYSSLIAVTLWYVLSLTVGLSLVYVIYQWLIRPQQSDTPTATVSPKSKSRLTDDTLDSPEDDPDFDYLKQAIEQAKATSNAGPTSESSPLEPLSSGSQNPPPAPVSRVPPAPVEAPNLSHPTPDLAPFQDRVKELVNQGVQKAASDDHWAAISKFNQAIRLDPNHAIAYYNRSLSYLKLNYGDEALQDCCKAIQLNPSYAKAYNCRGNIRKQRGDLRGACADYQHALDIDPTFTGARQNLEKAQARLQDKTTTKKKG